MSSDLRTAISQVARGGACEPGAARAWRTIITGRRAALVHGLPVPGAGCALCAP